MNLRKNKQHEDLTLLLDRDLSTNELVQKLRVNALHAHQVSMGRGDELVQILKDTIQQMKSANNRVQWMSVTLFGAGLVLLGVGVYEIAFGSNGDDVWAALLGGTGGIATVVATFWTAPIDKISASITDLVKLETAFLGYIRLIGEVDSGFQMQYLDILAKGDESKIPLDQVIDTTTKYVQEAMSTTIGLIDAHVASDGRVSKALEDKAAELEGRLKTLETKLGA